MDSNYVKALETRSEWLKWGVEKGVDEWHKIGRKFVPGLMSYLKSLENGDTFFMNKRFGALVENARSTVPDDLVFDSSWMQSPHGWMWLENPFTVPAMIEEPSGALRKTERNDIPITVAAIGWIPVEEGFQTANYMNDAQKGRVAGKGAYQFLCFQNFSTYHPDAKGFGCWSYFMLQDGDKLIDRIHQFEASAKQEGGAYEDRTADMMHEIRWIYSAMYLMAQRLAIKVTHRTDRHTAKRAIREKRVVTPEIQVISLRRFEEEKKKAEVTGMPVEWNWQWTVRGHWRNQYFPGSGEYRPVFIESFIKGPADKPMKPVSEKVFVARR